MAKILEVDLVTVLLAKSNPPQVIVEAVGKVSTSGWTGGELNPYTYIVPPQDGIIDFDFTATPPAGLALTVVRPITASTSFVAPDWFRGVRIHASTGEPKVATVDGDSFLAAAHGELRDPGGWISSGRKTVDGGVDGFPWMIAPH